MKTVTKQGVKGAVRTGTGVVRQNVKRGLKETAGAFQQVGKAGKQAGRALMKNGKVVFKGLQRSALKGAKTVGDLMSRLGKAFKFDKFRIRISGRKWVLEGHFNPWIVVTKGEVSKLEFEGNDIPHPGSNDLVNDFYKAIDDNKIKLDSDPVKAKEELDFLADHLNKNPNSGSSLEQILEERRNAAKAGINIAKNTRKMSVDDIGTFLGAGKDWHKTAAKSRFLNKFKKELKGDTNADFCVDRNTKKVFLKSNRSANWINTGQKFE